MRKNFFVSHVTFLNKKLVLDVQKERTNWDRERVINKMQIKKEKINLERRETSIKWELEKAQTFGEIEIVNKWLQLSQYAEDVKIMLTDESTLDEHAKK